MEGTVAANKTHMPGLAASWTHGKRIPKFQSLGRGSGVNKRLERLGWFSSLGTLLCPDFPKSNSYLFDLINTYIVFILGQALFSKSLTLLKTSLLRCNLYTVKFTYLKCTIYWFSVYHKVVQPLQQFKFRTFLSL